MNAQTAGLALVAVGAALLWSWWALVIAGVLLLVIPEFVSLIGRRR